MDEYSVLMTTYYKDTPTQLKIAIDSIINQTVKPFEIILLGDGPLPKELHTLIGEYVETSSYFRFVQIDHNVGLGEALNIGLELIKTQIVMRMDADDYSSKDRAEILMKELVSGAALVVGSYIGEFYSHINDCESIIKYEQIINFSDLKNYIRDPVGHASTMFYKDAVLSAGGYKDCLYFEDTYLWLRLANNKKGEFINVEQVLYYARIGNGFYERRGGLKYLIIEISNFFKFYREGLISSKYFLINILIRPVIRLLPGFLLKEIYRKLLRSAVER